MIWVVVTNTNTCDIYNYDKKNSSVSRIKKISHPEMRLKASETLTSDRPGHYHGGGAARGAFSPHTEVKDVEVTHFATEIAKELDKGRTTNAYEELIIITPPHMNGRLFQRLNDHVKKMVRNNIQKELLDKSERELADFLKTHAQHPDNA